MRAMALSGGSMMERGVIWHGTLRSHPTDARMLVARLIDSCGNVLDITAIRNKDGTHSLQGIMARLPEPRKAGAA